MKNRLLWFSLCLSVLMLSACLEGQNLHEEKEENKENEYIEYHTIRVNIASDGDGVLCLVYQEYPFDEQGSLIASPCLKAYTPINTYLQVPTTLKKLYVLVGTDTVYESGADAVNLHLK